MAPIIAARSGEVSIGGSTVTYQSLQASRRSRGDATIIGGGQAAHARQLLAAEHRIHMELSSAASLAAALSFAKDGLMGCDARQALQEFGAQGTIVGSRIMDTGLERHVVIVTT